MDKTVNIPTHLEISQRVKPMTPENISKVVAIEKRSNPKPWSKKMFLNEIFYNRFSHSYVLQTPTGEDLMGYTCFWIMDRELQILTLTIDPARRRQGFGNGLLQWVLDYGKQRGVTHASLEVRPSNTTAIRLYEKNGFEFFKKRENYYQDPKEDALILRNATIQTFHLS